ncbi:hypothetical protein [Cognatishimia activa]|uniref:hypothetical protein n=1 Tax=Cognatishimia activa TaxID=1715691 RepID=UPI00222FE7E1|nr:hypothetical protein [Cognatishimia activa]UZD89720.1 hypothetical protein M0D42_08935 [Cognatishimia activa]
MAQEVWWHGAIATCGDESATKGEYASTADTWDLEILTSNAEWKLVAAKAKAARPVFEKRGRFSGEIVETDKH